MNVAAAKLDESMEAFFRVRKVPRLTKNGASKPHNEDVPLSALRSPSVIFAHYRNALRVVGGSESVSGVTDCCVRAAAR